MNVFVRPPIVYRTVSNAHRTFVVEQPIICEHVHRTFNHHIRRNRFIPRNLCCEYNTCQVENVGCCPNMPCGAQPFGQGQGMGGFEGNQQFADMQAEVGEQSQAQPFDFMQGQFRNQQ